MISLKIILDILCRGWILEHARPHFEDIKCQQLGERVPREKIMNFEKNVEFTSVVLALHVFYLDVVKYTFTKYQKIAREA